jgi:DNA-binding HxlR family transcriptional regulator
MSSYGDYCPITIASEVIGDRWSPLVIREIMVGSHRFNDIHRGIPRISRSLLTQRLRHLERNGIIERTPRPGEQAVDYTLTDAGHALEPVLWDLGRWAAAWALGDPTDEQLDTAHLVWRLHQFTDPENAPTTRINVQFTTTGPGSGTAWLVFDQGESTACQIDPGYEVDLVVEGDNRELHRWFAGRVSWADAVRSGRVTISGPSGLARAFPDWFVADVFAPLPA